MHLYCSFTDRLWPRQTLLEQDSLLPWNRSTLMNELSFSLILMLFKSLVVVPNTLPGTITVWSGAAGKKSRPVFQWSIQKQSFPPGDFADVTVQQTPPAHNDKVLSSASPGVPNTRATCKLMSHHWTSAFVSTEVLENKRKKREKKAWKHQCHSLGKSSWRRSDLNLWTVQLTELAPRIWPKV